MRRLPRVKGFGSSIKRGWNKNNQFILAVAAGISAVGAVVLAFRGGEKIVEVKETYRDKKEDATIRLQEGEISQEDFEKEIRSATVEAAKGFCIYYGPAIVTVTITVVCTAFGYKIGIGKQVAALAAYKASESKIKELEDKTKELLGEKKFDEIKTEILKDRVESKEIPEDVHAPEYKKDAEGNYLPEPYEMPCWFDWTKHYWMSRRSDIEDAIAAACRNAIDRGDDVLKVSTLMRFLDPDGEHLEYTDVCDTHGWRVEDFIFDSKKQMKIIPYRLIPITRSGFEHAILSLVIEPEYIDKN